MAAGEVDLGSLPAEEIFRLLESNNQQVPKLTVLCLMVHFRWSLKFTGSSTRT